MFRFKIYSADLYKRELLIKKGVPEEFDHLKINGAKQLYVRQEIGNGKTDVMFFQIIELVLSEIHLYYFSGNGCRYVLHFNDSVYILSHTLKGRFAPAVNRNQINTIGELKRNVFYLYNDDLTVMSQRKNISVVFNYLVDKSYFRDFLKLQPVLKKFDDNISQGIYSLYTAFDYKLMQAPLRSIYIIAGIMQLLKSINKEAIWSIDDDCADLLWTLTHPEIKEANCKFNFEIIEKVHEFVSMMPKHLNDKNFVASFIGEQHLSQYKIREAFKGIFGYSPYEYFHDLRIEEAHAIMRKGNYSEINIAQSVGYNSFKSLKKAIDKYELKWYSY